MILLLIFYVIKTLILNPIVTALFIRGRKLNISFVFITQSYFAVQTYENFNKLHFIIHQILLLTLKTL